MKPLRTPLFDPAAKRQTVSLTINADLYARAKQLGINVSRAAERALAEVLSQETAKKVEAEIRQDLDAYRSYLAQHGSPVEAVQEHHERSDKAV